MTHNEISVIWVVTHKVLPMVTNVLEELAASIFKMWQQLTILMALIQLYVNICY